MFLEMFFISATLSAAHSIWPSPIIDLYKEYHILVRDTCINETEFDYHERDRVVAEFYELLDYSTNIPFVPDPGMSESENIEAEVLINLERAKYVRAAEEAKQVIETITCAYIQDADKI